MLSVNCQIIYDLFAKHKKLSDIDLLRRSKLNSNSIRPTRLKLERMGLIRRTNKKKIHSFQNRGSGEYTMYELVRTTKTPPVKHTKSKVSVSKLINELNQIKNKIDSIISQL